MEYITESVHPFKNDESVIEKCIIGSVILFASILLLPYFFYQGYLFRILEQTQNGVPEELPEWNNFTGLFTTGLAGSVLSLMIQLPAYIIMYTPQLAPLNDSAAIVAQVVGTGISVVLSYLTTALIALYVRDGIESVFDLPRIKRIALSADYLIAYVVLAVGGIAFGVFIVMLVVFTIGFGILLLPFVIVPVNYLFMIIVGSAISEAERTTENNTTDRDSSSEDYM